MERRYSQIGTPDADVSVYKLLQVSVCYASFSSQSTVSTINKLGSTNTQIEKLNDPGSLYVWSWFACFEALIVLLLFDKFADLASVFVTKIFFPARWRLSMYYIHK